MLYHALQDDYSTVWHTNFFIDPYCSLVWLCPAVPFFTSNSCIVVVPSYHVPKSQGPIPASSCCQVLLRGGMELETVEPMPAREESRDLTEAELGVEVGHVISSGSRWYMYVRRVSGVFFYDVTIEAISNFQFQGLYY